VRHVVGALQQRAEQTPSHWRPQCPAIGTPLSIAEPTITPRAPSLTGIYMWCSCCEPCKWCGNGGSLSNHRDAVERAAAASEAAAAQTAAMQAMVEACGQAQVASEALEDKIARMVEGVEQSHLNSCADMHLRHFLPQNAVARHKEALTSILVAQTAAIKASLEGKLREGCDIDEVIGPIMAATDKFRSSACEHRARAASYPANTQVTPQLRKLKAADGSGEVWLYDIPLETSLQRELYYNPQFAKYFCDWPGPSPDGIYRSTQDGSVAREHPALGQADWAGPPRLAFAHYYDDVEVVNPIGAARVKHKLALHYVQLLNSPPHIRSSLSQIFLVSVALKSSQDAAGMAAVIDGAADEPYNGTSLGASLRRFHDGIIFEVPKPDGPGMVQMAYKGWLILGAADTLAAAELIGFKKGWGKHVKSLCWQCDAAAGTGLSCTNSFLGGHRSCHYVKRTPAVYRQQRNHTIQLPIAKKRGERSVAARKACSHQAGSCVCTQGEYMQTVGVTTFNHAYRRVPYAGARAVHYMPRDLMHVELEGMLGQGRSV
jgi:hypothetical protein